jgi:hypothetical protein
VRVQLRGWSGSGKSRIVRRLITEHDGVVLPQPNMPEFVRVKESGKRETIRVDVWRLDGNLYVLGNYDLEKETTTGADKMNGAVAVPMMRWYLPKVEHLIWEGRNGSQDPPKGELLDALREFGVVWATLDTPADACVAAQYDRRLRTGRGSKKPINIKSFASGYNRTHRFVDDAHAAGVPCRTVPHPPDSAYFFVHDLLEEGGWSCTSRSCTARADLRRHRGNSDPTVDDGVAPAGD